MFVSRARFLSTDALLLTSATLEMFSRHVETLLSVSLLAIAKTKGHFGEELSRTYSITYPL